MKHLHSHTSIPQRHEARTASPAGPSPDAVRAHRRQRQRVMASLLLDSRTDRSARRTYA